MVFGIIKSISKEIEQVASDAIDVGAAYLTLGDYGELSKANVSRLIAAGMTVAMLSEATGVAVDVIEKVLED